MLQIVPITTATETSISNVSSFNNLITTDLTINDNNNNTTSNENMNIVSNGNY